MAEDQTDATAKLQVHVGIPEDGRQLQISESSARFLLSILDRISFAGPDQKFAAGAAQMELLTALSALAVDGQPANRAQRRAQARNGSPLAKEGGAGH